MKSLLFTLLCVCSIYTSGHSQVLIALVFGDKLNSPNMEFGLHAGANFAYQSNYKTDPKGALNLGFYFNFRLNDKLWIHPEVVVKSGNFMNGIAPYPLGEENLDELFADGNVLRKLSYIQVPILIKYDLPKGFALYGGVAPALRTKSFDNFLDEIDKKNDLVFEKNISDEYTRLDFGLAGGLSWRPRVDRGVTIVARYTLGLVDVLKDNPGDPRRNRAIAVGALIPVGVAKSKAAAEAKVKERQSE